MRVVIAILTVASALLCGTARAEAPNRLSLSVQQDFGIASSDTPCSRAGQLDQDFACFREDGAQYHGTPTPESDSAGPVGLGTTRILLGYDRFLLPWLALGARAGFTLGGGPQADGADAPAFLPFHLEGRLTFWLGEPSREPGFAAGLFVMGGIAQVDTHFEVLVIEYTSTAPPAGQRDNPPSQTLDAYHKAGTGCAGGGLTVAYAPAVMHTIFFEAKATGLFPSVGVAMSPVLGYALGL